MYSPWAIQHWHGIPEVRPLLWKAFPNVIGDGTETPWIFLIREQNMLEEIRWCTVADATVVPHSSY